MIKYLIHNNNLIKQIIYSIVLLLYIIPNIDDAFPLIYLIFTFLLSNRIIDDLFNRDYDIKTKKQSIIDETAIKPLWALGILLSKLSIVLSYTMLNDVWLMTAYYILSVVLYIIISKRKLVDIIPLLKYPFIGYLIDYQLTDTFDFAMISLFFVVFAFDVLDDERINYSKGIIFLSLAIASVFIYDQTLDMSEIILLLPFIYIFTDRIPKNLIFVPYLFYRLI